MLIKIADSHERHTAKERRTAVADALNAMRELRTYLMISRQLGYVSWLRARRLHHRIQPIDKMLDHMVQSLAPPRDNPTAEQSSRNAA